MDFGCLPPKGIRSTSRKRVAVALTVGEGREVELSLGRTLLAPSPAAHIYWESLITGVGGWYQGQLAGRRALHTHL